MQDNPKANFLNGFKFPKIAENEERLEAICSRLDDYEKKINTLSSQVSSLLHDVDILKAEIADNKANIDKLNTDIDSLFNNLNRNISNQVLSQLEKWLKDDNLPLSVQNNSFNKQNNEPVNQPSQQTFRLYATIGAENYLYVPAVRNDNCNVIIMPSGNDASKGLYDFRQDCKYNLNTTLLSACTACGNINSNLTDTVFGKVKRISKDANGEIWEIEEKLQLKYGN